MTNDIKVAISAANKFHRAIKKSFKAGNIPYECKNMLDLTYSLSFLKAIKRRNESKINMLENLFIREHSIINSGYSAFKSQIEADEKLFDSFFEYNDSVIYLVKEIQIKEITREIAQEK